MPGHHDVWDGRFELAFASFINRYLAENPPPPDALLAEDGRRTAYALALDGRRRLARAGAKPVHAIPEEE